MGYLLNLNQNKLSYYKHNFQFYLNFNAGNSSFLRMKTIRKAVVMSVKYSPMLYFKCFVKTRFAIKTNLLCFHAY